MKADEGFYGVTLVKYAWVYVKASSAKEAMKIADSMTDELERCCGSCLGELDFDDSNIGVDSCETYPTDFEDLDDDQVIIVDGEVHNAEDFYIDDDEEEEKEAWQRGGWDMTGQTSLDFEEGGSDE